MNLEMEKRQSRTVAKVVKALWEKGVNLGVAAAPPDEQPRVRRLNNALFGYIVSGHVYTLIYLCLGAWRLLAIQIALSFMAPLALWLNFKGYYRVARIYQSMSFSIAIAIIICLVGEETYIALLFFPAIASVFVNFQSHEKTDLKISLFVATAITGASQLYAHAHEAWIFIDPKWLPLMRTACWVGSISIFVSQIYMFFKSVDESKEALMLSHAHMHDMLASVDDGFYFVNREWTLLYYNPKAAFYLEMHGIKNAQGRNFWELVETENARTWVTNLGDAMQTGVIYREEYYDEIQDLWTEVVGFPSDSGMSITFRVITERKKNEIALRESEQLQRAIFEHAATGLAITSPQGQFQQVNPELCRILGYDAKEFVGLFAHDITVRDEQHQTHADVATIVSGAADKIDRQKKYIHKSGRSVQANLQVRTLRDEKGLPKFNVVSIQDLTDSKLAEQKLFQASKMSSLGEMAGSIAHEINSPMAVIQLSAEQLEDPEMVEILDKEEIAAIGKRISDTVVRISKIIKGLKTFSRNAERDEMEATAVKSLIDDTLELCRERFKQKGIALRLGEVSEIQTRCRPTEICQVLLNLLSNSFDAVDSSGLTDRWVEVSAVQSDSNVEISVVDSGPGIPKAIIKRMHEPFFTTKSIGKGTGLGLSISKGIVEMHGGKLFLDESSKRTRFVIQLKADLKSESARAVESLKVVPGGN